MQNSTPLVAVLMVTYNHEKFVAQAIESVMIQKTNFPYRLFIGEDCSTDRTADICSELKAKYKDRIELYINRTNLGAIVNSNQIVEVCNRSGAKYMAILEGDDYWTDENKLQIQVDVMEKQDDVAICFHNCEEFYNDVSTPPYNYCPKTMNERPKLEDLLAYNFIPTSSKLVRINALKRLPDWYMKIVSNDWVLNILYAERGSIYYIDRLMSRHRLHSGGRGFNRERMHKDIIRVYKYLNRYFHGKYSAIIRKNISLQFLHLFDLLNLNNRKIGAMPWLLCGFYYDFVGVSRILISSQVTKIRKLRIPIGGK